jgi:hypothetical protein
MSDPYPQYKALRFIVDKGNYIPGVAFLGAAVITGLIWASSNALVVLPVGILISIALGLLVRSYVELVRVIVDMLLPK